MRSARAAGGVLASIAQPTHLKIDVDGPELQVLDGARDLLRSPDLRHIVVELQQDSEATTAIELLRTYGFRMTGEHVTGLATGSSSAPDHLRYAEAMSEETFARRATAAWDVMKELESSRDVVGAFHFGSSCRPYADANSDIDIGVVVEAHRLDAAAAYLHPLRAKLTAHGVDLSYWADSLLASPRADDDRRRLSVCSILYDPRGEIAGARDRYALVPEDVRQVRVRMHYFDVVRQSHLVHKAEERGDRALVLLLTAQVMTETAKLLFIERGHWPSPLSWIRKELELLEHPLTATLYGILDAPAISTLRLFRRRLDRYLLERGHAFVADPIGLMDWYFSSEEGLRARREWGSPQRTG